MKDTETAQMKLDIIRWMLEDAEQQAAGEYKELCRERPKEYGDRPFCIKENTYKASFYKTLCDEVVFMIGESDVYIRREWERLKAEKEPEYVRNVDW